MLPCDELLATLGTRSELERGGLAARRRDKQIIVFAQLGAREGFLGYSWRELRNGAKEARTHGVFCHTAVEIQSVIGCPFDCTYCPDSGFICVDLDVEGFVQRVADLAIERSAQSLFKLNNRSDTLGLKPEYGLAPALVERFATLENKYLMLYSKGDSVQSLLELDHRGKTIASFTLTPQAIADRLETGAPAPSRRLAAIRALAQAGYPIRVRLSPIVPIRSWESAYEQLIADLARACEPEMVTLWTLSMIDVEDFDRIVPSRDIDPEILAAAQASADTMRGRKGAPFPELVREQIYRTLAAMVARYSPKTLVSLCLETADVWNVAGGDIVPRCGGDFLCNCGPKATGERLVQLVRPRHRHAQ